MAKQTATLTCSRLEAENTKNEECQISFKTNFRKKNIQTIKQNLNQILPSEIYKHTFKCIWMCTKK